jgi:hypothetical protein
LIDLQQFCTEGKVVKSVNPLLGMMEVLSATRQDALQTGRAAGIFTEEMEPLFIVTFRDASILSLSSSPIFHVL